MEPYSNNPFIPYNTNNPTSSQGTASLAEANSGVSSTGSSTNLPVTQAFQQTTNAVSSVGRANIEIQDQLKELSLEDSKHKKRKVQPNNNGASSSAEHEDIEVAGRSKIKSRKLQNGNDHETRSSQNQSNQHQLRGPYPIPEIHNAALAKDVNGLMSLIDKDNHSVNSLDKVGNTPLHIAAGAGSVDCLSALIDRKAAINNPNQNGLRPLHLAVRHGHRDCFLKLIENGAEIDARNNDSISPFHIAAKYGRVEILEDLITISTARGKNQLIDGKDSWGQTPLHYAVIQNKVKCAEILIQMNAHIEWQDRTGMTPLLSAIVSGSSDCVKLLMLKNADLTHRNHSNKNAIHLAADSMNCDTAEIVLKKLKGLKGEEEFKKLINEEDNMGISPLEFAMNDEMRNLLIQNGAKEEEKGINPTDTTCTICQKIFYKSVTLACGHTYCRSCIQSWRPMHDTCPDCTAEVRLVGGYDSNWRADNALKAKSGDEIKEREDEKKGDALECTIDNLITLGHALGTEILLDKNNTAILAINNDFPMHLTYMATKKRLCMYSPILAAFPKGEKAEALLTNIFKAVLFNNGFGDGMSGVGVIMQKELIAFHIEIPMEFAPSDTLRRKSIPFVELVKRWREAMIALSNGEQIADELKQRIVSLKLSSVPPYAHLDDVQKNLNKLPKEEYRVINNASDWTIVTKDKATKDKATKDKATKDIATKDIVTKDSIPPICVQYLINTDVIRLSCPLYSGIPDHLSLYQELLSASVFGYKTAGGRFQITEDGELILIFDVQLTRTGPNLFSDTTLKERLPNFVQQIKEWKNTVAERVTQLKQGAVVDDKAMVMD